MTTYEDDLVDDEPKQRRVLVLLVGLLRLAFNSLIFAVVILCVGFILFATNVEVRQASPKRPADGIAVLTGGAARIDEAMKLLANGKAKRLLITGVYRDTTREELKKLATEGSQLFTCCVDIDREARNTIDNATETSEWVVQHKYRSIIVVTSNYHMPRALAELGRVMPGVRLVPYSVVDNNAHVDQWWAYPGTTKLLLSEYLKYLPALGRLGATQLVRHIVSGGKTIAAEDEVEP